MNKQETKELEYFQKIQVLRHQVSSLKLEIGMLTSERDELRFKLKKESDYKLMAEELKATKKVMKRLRSDFLKASSDLMIAKQQGFIAPYKKSNR